MRRNGEVAMGESRLLPNFLVIGAQKCGTTWLHQILRQHPEVFVPKCKEIHFFNKKENYNKGIEWYQSFFERSSCEKIAGEVTPNYFWTGNKEKTYYDRTNDILAIVESVLADAKFILTLRDPVDRAISAYYEHIRQGRISPHTRISDVLDLYGILSMGYYDIHFQRWVEYFSRDQFLVLFLEEDIAPEGGVAAKKVYDFLEVDSSFVPTGLQEKRKSRKSHLFMRLKHISTRLAYLVADHVPHVEAIERMARIPVHQEEIDALKDEYATHTNKLEKLLGRKLPW